MTAQLEMVPRLKNLGAEAKLCEEPACGNEAEYDLACPKPEGGFELKAYCRGHANCHTQRHASPELGADQRLPPKGVKDDAGKDPWDLFPWIAAYQVVLVLEFGRITYDGENWRGVKGAKRRYFAAAMRHLFAWWRGEAADPESGLSHLAHAACCVLFVLELEMGAHRPMRDADGELAGWAGNLTTNWLPRLGPKAVEIAKAKKAKRAG